MDCDAVWRALSSVAVDLDSDWPDDDGEQVAWSLIDLARDTSSTGLFHPDWIVPPPSGEG
jgi:hypothetical protein